MGKINIYAQCEPMPFQVGIDGKMILTVKKSEARCEAIYLKFYIGATADSLFSDSEKHPPVVRIDGDDNWEITGPTKPDDESPDADPLQQHYRFANNNSPATIPDDFDIIISGLVNGACGTAEVVAATGEDIYSFDVPKTAATFYLRNFMTRKAPIQKDAANIPITEFKNGEPVYFSWESNGTSYKLYNGRDEKPVFHTDDGAVTSCAVDGVSKDTTFVLVAERKDGTDTLQLIDRIGVTVSNPDVKAKSVSVVEGLVAGFRVENYCAAADKLSGIVLLEVLPLIDINSGSGSGIGWNFKDGVLNITANGSYKIGGTGVKTANKIEVMPGVTANIMFVNVNIESDSGGIPAAFYLHGANVNLWLVGVNRIIATSSAMAGIGVGNGASIIIGGTGSLYAQGANGLGGAGIGGHGGNNSAGTIIINGGDIIAQGGTGGYYSSGAGIGGAWQGPGGTIIITGGVVRATSGGNDARGIGGTASWIDKSADFKLEGTAVVYTNNAVRSNSKLISGKLYVDGKIVFDK